MSIKEVQLQKETDQMITISRLGETLEENSSEDLFVLGKDHDGEIHIIIYDSEACDFALVPFNQRLATIHDEDISDLLDNMMVVKTCTTMHEFCQVLCNWTGFQR